MPAVRILIAEDEQLLADTIADGLRRLAMAVDVCYDGQAALDLASTYRYDVIVLDRDMPVRSGDDVCRELAGSDDTVRVLMLTAASGIRDRVDGLGLGADDYLTKPFAFPSSPHGCRHWAAGPARRSGRCWSALVSCSTRRGTTRHGMAACWTSPPRSSRSCT